MIDLLKPNLNGRITIWANYRGEYLGKQIVDELNRLIDFNNSEKERIITEQGINLPQELIPLEDRVILSKPVVKEFPNGFFSVHIPGSVRGSDAYLIQMFPKPAGITDSKYVASRNLQEFLATTHSLLKSHVDRFTFITPYAYHQRKDRTDKRGATLGPEMFPRQLMGIVAGRGVTVNGYCLDMHSAQQTSAYQVAGFNMDSLPVFDLFADYIKEHGLEHGISLEDKSQYVVIPPDFGAIKKGRTYAKKLGLNLVPVEKQGSSADGDIVVNVYGRKNALQDKIGLVFDDIIESGKTVDELLATLKKDYELKEAYLFMTHADFTDMERLDRMHKEGLFKKLFILDLAEVPNRDYIVKVPAAQFLAQAIYNHHYDTSVSKLFGGVRE